MALFCARYLTSLPFTLGLGSNEIGKHAITGYYGFQDYAAAFWWKHAHRVINTATGIDTDLYNEVLQAVARAMEAYGGPSNSPPEPGRHPTDAVKHCLQELAEDAHEWENNFKIEFRTRAIRNTIEGLLTEEGASETHCSIITLYGSVRYKCHKPWCQSFYRGFERREDRDQHLLEHDRPFRCCVEGCYGNEIGFPSESDLSRHTERLHSTQSTIHFASPRPLKSGPRVICSAAATGDLAKVKACLLAGVPIDTATKNKGGETPLYLAAKNGHIHICQYLLEQGADLNFQGGRGHKRTALHAAALADDVELTHLLLSQPEATPQLKDSEYFTAAGTAAKNGCNNSLSVFISRGLASQPNQDGAGNTCLSIAMDSGNLNTAELLINDTSLDLNEEYGEYGDMDCSKLPLHIATWTGLVGIVKLLLSTGRVDVNKADLSGRRALHHACGNGHNSIVELLLPVIDDHDVRDDRGTTPFHYAAQRGHVAVSNLLLERGKVDANSKDYSGRTPLLYATENGHWVIVKLLLEKGANIESTDFIGSTLLWDAVTNRDEGVVKLLLEKGANIESTDKFGWTPLIYAVKNGQEAIVKLLLEKGANTELTSNYGWTPLIYAVINRHGAIVKLLLEKGANTESTDKSGSTPLIYAVYNGHGAIVKLLLEKGANTELTDYNGSTPLTYAAKNGHEAIVKLLLEKGANTESTDKSGSTPLIYAVNNGYEVIVKLLLEKGANIESTDKFGWTPLIYAAKNGHEAIVKPLLEKGANTESTNDHGLTPLIYAAKNGHEAVVKLLLEKGANTELTDYNGSTPLTYAAKNGHKAVLKLLRPYKAQSSGFAFP